MIASVCTQYCLTVVSIFQCNSIQKSQGFLYSFFQQSSFKSEKNIAALKLNKTTNYNIHFFPPRMLLLMESIMYPIRVHVSSTQLQNTMHMCLIHGEINLTISTTYMLPK